MSAIAATTLSASGTIASVDPVEADERAAPGDGDGHFGLRVVQAAQVADGQVIEVGAGLLQQVELPQRGVARDLGARPAAGRGRRCG